MRKLALALALTMVHCRGPQSALDPAGVAAERIAQLFGWMAGGAVIVWLLVVGLAVYAGLVQPERHRERVGNRVILLGGVVLPTVVLAILLVFGLSLLRDLEAPPEQPSFKIEVRGEQWWWRVRYHVPDRGPVELANEIRLPVGERVELELESADVIHSFWIPSLAGKRDMVPGRTTRLTVEPTRTGVFRGACAEYCGASHARMAFHVVVMAPRDFEAWLEDQRRSAATPEETLAIEGRDLFFASGCGACHRVRGTRANGVVGPDLTHVGSRLGLAAATLDNEPAGFARWVSSTKSVKPGAHMPRFGMFPASEIAALAAYMESLQ